MSKKTYQELKSELDDVMIRLQDPVTDIDDAIALHDQAKKLIAELEAYLDDAGNAIKKSEQ